MFSLRCPIVAHWGCLAKTQRDEILKAALERDMSEWLSAKPAETDEDAIEDWMNKQPKKRAGLDKYQTTEFICGSCVKGGICYACKEIAVQEDSSNKATRQPAKEEFKSNLPTSEAAEMASGASTHQPTAEDMLKDINVPDELVFRCSTCKRVAHYAHLPNPPNHPDTEYSPVELAVYYQETNRWQCSDCITYIYSLDQILAWRPSSKNATEPNHAPDEIPNYKESLPREYLIKWADRSYLRLQWVPHMWLLATNPSKLSNFLKSGSQVRLLPEPVPESAAADTALEEPVSTFGVGAEEQEEDSEIARNTVQDESSTPSALPDAEQRIPPAWKVVDRVLDVLLWAPEKRLTRLRKAKTGGRYARMESESEKKERLRDAELLIGRERDACYDLGEQPSDDIVERVVDWERRTRQKFTIQHSGLVIWGLFKWNGLNYDNGRGFLIFLRLCSQAY